MRRLGSVFGPQKHHRTASYSVAPQPLKGQSDTTVNVAASTDTSQYHGRRGGGSGTFGTADSFKRGCADNVKETEAQLWYQYLQGLTGVAAEKTELCAQKRPHH